MMLFVFDAWNNASLFQTGWFVESLLTQTLIIHIIRTAKIPVHREPGQSGADRHDDHHLLRRNRAAVHLGRQRARVHAAALALLAAGRLMLLAMRC